MRIALTAEEVLERLIPVLLRYLEELRPVRSIQKEMFQYGEKTAYIECFEYIQEWEKAEKYNIDFDAEFYFEFE